jgi:peptidoglycan/LPS O-acetylase OafA/YrhL
MTAEATALRHHAMDALRAFALLLGVFFHAAESFCPERWSWAIVDVRAHWIAAFFQHTVHSFRMPLFFVMAGFFAHMLIQQRGVRRFATQRLQRVALPFVLGWLLIVPLGVLLWIAGSQMSGQYPALAAYLRIDAPEDAGALRATWDYYRSGAALREGFTLGHLWFLNQLIHLYLIFLILRGVGALLQERGFPLTGTLDTAFAWALRSGTLLPLLAALVTLPILAMNGSVSTPNNTLLPPPEVTCTYAVCFALGWLLHRQPALLPQVGTNWVGLLLGGFTLAVVGQWSGGLPAWLGTDSETARFGLVRSFVQGLTMWCLVFGFIGLFQRFANTGNRTWRYLADASYWIYLVHIPLVVALQLLVWELDVHGGLKYAAIMATSLPILVLSYHYLVRATTIGVLLNGQRLLRAWPWSAA